MSWLCTLWHSPPSCFFPLPCFFTGSLFSFLFSHLLFISYITWKEMYLLCLKEQSLTEIFFGIIPLFHLQVRASSSYILCTLQFLLACILWVGITSITIILWCFHLHLLVNYNTLCYTSIIYNLGCYSCQLCTNVLFFFIISYFPASFLGYIYYSCGPSSDKCGISLI